MPNMTNKREKYRQWILSNMREETSNSDVCQLFLIKTGKNFKKHEGRTNLPT